MDFPNVVLKESVGQKLDQIQTLDATNALWGQHAQVIDLIRQNLPWATFGGSLSLVIRGLLCRNVNDIDLTITGQDYDRTSDAFEKLLKIHNLVDILTQKEKVALKAESLAALAIGQHRSMSVKLRNSQICIFVSHAPFAIDYYNVGGLLLPLTGLNTVLQAKRTYATTFVKHGEDLSNIRDRLKEQSLQDFPGNIVGIKADGPKD